MMPNNNVFAQRFGAPGAGSNIARPIMPGGGGMQGPGMPGAPMPVAPGAGVNAFAPGGAHMMPVGGPVRPVMGLPGNAGVRPMMPPAAPQNSSAAIPQPINNMRMRLGLR